MSGMASVHPADPVNNILAGKRFKMYLVEMDDDDRERVISGEIETAQIQVDYDTSSVFSDTGNYPVASYRTNQIVTLSARVIGGTLRYENFSEPEEDDEDA